MAGVKTQQVNASAHVKLCERHQRHMKLLREYSLIKSHRPITNSSDSAMKNYFINRSPHSTGLILAKLNVVF